MLLRFRVSNYASLRDEQELSLVAVDDHPDLATQPIPRENLHALPAVGIFGQNASGKSNVIKALNFAATAVRGSHQQWLPDEGVPRSPFRLSPAGPASPTEFVLELVIDSVRYEYGFTVDDTAVRREWLFAYPLGKRRLLFERQDESLHFGNSLAGPRELIAEVIRPNSLFLSAAAANNHRQLSAVYRWFATNYQSAPSRLSSSFPPRTIPPDRILRLLRYADLGVIGAELVPPTPEERDRHASQVRGRRPSPRATDMAPSENIRQYLSNEDEQLAPDPELPPRVELVHEAETDSGSATLPWRSESTGTHAWWALLRQALRVLDSGTLLTIDDLGSGLHPLLTAQLIRLFHDPRTNPHGAQLVFNTHDTGLLGRHHSVRLARDQIWLTEKDRSGATKLFPLTEFRVRDHLDDVEGRYLKGRYGAVPFFDEDLLTALTDPGDSTP